MSSHYDTKRRTYFKRKLYRTVYVDFEGLVPIDPDSPAGRILAYCRERGLDPDPYFFEFTGKHKKRAYETPEELEKAIQDYFLSCEGEVFTKAGLPVKDSKGNPVIRVIKPYTITGLALALGLTPASVMNYKEVAKIGNLPIEFSFIITKARNRIQAYAEGRLYDMEGQRGAQFVLDKGFSWLSNKERREIKMAAQKLKLQKEEHKAKMDLLKLNEGEERDINIKIVRAGENT